MAEFFIGATVTPGSEARGENITVESDDFTTHGVIVGMTGSGKTGLGVILIEEVLSSGLPVLVIDPKGDLTNLCLTFPDMRAEDFRPWVDESQAKAAGVSADEFAAQQAELWSKGLADWGLSGENIGRLRATTDFTIYTPGSNSGVPLNLVGSLQVPPTSDEEIVGDEIEGYVSGLLGLVGIAADPLSSREHILLSNLIAHSWGAGKALDLATLVGQIQSPPIRKLGVFELDQFFPPNDRSALAMKLNGLLASPSFAAWAAGPPLDVDQLLFRDGKPRCAIVTTAHLSDDERQFVTSLVLSKLITWMRRQSGVTDLRTMLYMDEVAGYLPPTENPPTKKPIMTLMKQARAFGVGVVLATQNPVDIDYKAISNAGTWMVGRLQTERDKQRLLDGMSAAAGGVDVAAVSDTISALGKRQFVLRRAGKDAPETFTTRWAMSYLRGPLTREQISSLMKPAADPTAGTPAAAPSSAPATEPATEGTPAPPDSTTTGTVTTDAPASEAPQTATDARAAASASPPAATTPVADDETPVMPDVAGGVAVRYVDPAAPWLAAVGGASTGGRRAAAVVARVALRYDESSAGDLVHDTEYEAVLHPLAPHVDVSTVVPVDYDDRDLSDTMPDGTLYRLGDAPLGTKSFFTDIERALADHLARSLSMELPSNKTLKLFGRPGEAQEAFEQRCAAYADEQAEADIAKLRGKYEAKAAKLRGQVAAASDRAQVVDEQARSREHDGLLDTAGDLLGGLLSGRRSKGSLVGSILKGAGRRPSSADQRRREEAQNKVTRLEEDLAEVEAELAEEITEIDAAWMAKAKQIETIAITLEKSDVKVTQFCLAWLPID